MKTSTKVLIAVVAIVLIIGLYSISTYNKLIRLEEDVNTKWADVEVHLQRRFDLIPNLVESVKGSMEQEKEIFGAIADARAKMAGATTLNEEVAASSELEGALSRLLVVMENYPDLKSNENVKGLMDELAGTENRISVHRSRYNETVQKYNRTVRSFPSNIIANMAGHETKKQFEAVQGSDKPPAVEF